MPRYIKYLNVLLKTLKSYLMLTLTLFSLLSLWTFSYSTISESNKGLVGHWQGTCKYGNNSLHFTVDISKNDSVYSALFGSDVQRTLNIPLRNVRFFKDSVHFELRGDNNSWIFDGKLKQAKISGRVTKGTQTASFSLNKTN